MTRHPRMLMAAAVLCATFGGGIPLNGKQQAAAAPSAASAPDVTTLGPQVGEKVPDFTLPDQHGRAQSLTSLTGDKGLVLVFYRSADW